MSGIIGYIGHRRALPIVVQALKLMNNYRYDSCGLLLKQSDHFFIEKTVGTVADLEKKVIDYGGNQIMGAAHLRWATRGEVTEKNIHPVFDCHGKIAVMHKGALDNYRDLKDMLEAEGHIFSTDTDSEILAHLIEKYYDGNLASAVRKALNLVEGTYGLIVFYRDNQMEMVVANAGMDLMLGIGEGEYWIASAEEVLYPFTDKVVYINDGEMVRITQDGFVSSLITGGSINVVNKKVEKIVIMASNIGQYFDQVEKEIAEQPEAIKNIIAGRLDEQKSTINFGGLAKNQDFLRQTSRLVFVGSGSSYYASMMAREIIEDYVAVTVSVYSGLEFRYKRFVLSNEKTALFVISQSGETEDTVAAMREAVQLGVTVYGITNAVGSPVSRETTSGIFLHSGPSHGVPSARNFMSQLLALIMLAVFLGRLKGLSPASGSDIILSLKLLPGKFKQILDKSYVLKNMVKKYTKSSNCLVIGSKYGYPVAKEIAMLLNSMAAISTEALSASELRYRQWRRINEDFVVLFMLPRDAFYESNLVMLKIIKDQKAKVVVVTEEGDHKLEGLFDDIIYLPHEKEIIMPLTMLLVMQLWSLYFAKEINVDNVPDSSNIW